MSDVYDAPDIGDPENFMTRRAQAQAQLALEASPDDAARAIDLGKATGIPSPVVASDMERIDNQYKSKLTSGIIDNNQFIRDYINAHPLAAAVSNDDYGQLDAASGAIAKVGQKGFVENTGDIVKGIWHGLASGPEEYKQIAAGSEDFLLKMGMEPGAAKAEAANISRRAYRNEELTNLLFAIPSLALSPVQGAFRTYAAQPLERNFGVPVQVSEGLGVALAGWLGLAGGLKAQTKLTQTAERVAPYVKNGEIPPPGIDPVVDKIHTEQAKADKDALNDALKESAASATRDRAPDLFAEFARSHDSAKGNIGIAADAIRGLYGDKVPEPDDGVLGWVPDLQAKLEAAEATGGDVEVPIADYLAKVEPDIHKELVDNIRVRPQGITVEEGKLETPPAPEGEAAAPAQPETILDTLRQEQPSTKAIQLELPQEGTTRLEDRKPFAGPPPGFTKQMYDLYLKKIAERRADDADWLSKRFLEFQRKTQSAEWKANRAEMRPGIKDEIEAQPVVAADKLLRDGDVKLSAEHGEGLPPEWLAKEGIHPDDLAGLLGHDTGAELLAELRGMVNARGDAPAAAFLKEMIDHTTDQRMMEKFGDLDKNIISEAKDQVLSGIQEEILHQETMARAAEAGLQFSIPPDQLRAAVIRHFNQLPISAVTSDKFLADAGRAGRKAEVAGLKGDAAGAFREAQRREFAFIAAREARKVEKEIKGFDRTAKRFSAREVKGVDQEYTNWIHQVLLRIGSKVNRSLQDLGDSIGRTDTPELAEFVEYKENHGLREVPVADFLMDDAWKKDYKDLTVEEFRAVKDSIKALEHNGREETTILKAGEAADLEQIKAKMIEQIQKFKPYQLGAEKGVVQPFAGVRRAFRTALVSHLQAETVMNRLDRFDPKGVFSQYVFRGLSSGANDEASMLRAYAKKLGAIADDTNLREKVPNNIFTDPALVKKDGEGNILERGPPMAMTRKNLRAVLLNAGNENNLWKMARGYELDPPTVMDWLHQNATKQDWDWAQKVWGMFKELKGQSDTMYRSLSGIEPAGLEIKPVATPHGIYEGGYYPLIRHPTMSADIKLFKDGLEGQGYVRATTPAGYTKSRTGAIYPLSLDLDSLPNQLRQVIHDIALRPAVLQASKIFYDKKLMAQMTRHLGPEYADMFIPWLRDVANVQNFTSSAQKSMSQFSDFMRQNAITTLVGFNVGTAMKHTPTALISSMAEVGPVNFLKALRSMVSINEETGDRNWRFAISQSEELQRRSRNWSETMGGGLTQLEGRTAGQALKQGDYGSAFMSLREAITELSSKPVAIGDLISAVPTWLAKYEAEILDHGIHGDAVAAADKAVRQAHGSSAITSRAAVARSQSALTKWMTGFFTFFNDLFNRQVETIWRAGEIKGMVNEGRQGDAMKEAANVGGRLFAYVIAPAMIEELVTPLTDKDHSSWGMTAAKALAFTLSSSWVGVRDIVNAALNKRDPSVGLITTAAKSVTDFIRDFEAKKGVKTENVIKHGTQLSGMLTGLTPAPLGRAAEFGYKVRTGQEKPKGPWGWLVGLRYGTTKGHSGTFDQYMKGK